MALTEPLDLLDSFPGWSTDFALQARQEQSRHASGRTRTKDLGSPLWAGTWATRVMNPNELDRWRALLSAAMIDQMTFRGRKLSRCRPAMHPGSSTLPTGELQSVGVNNKAIRVDDLPGISLSVGDMIQIGNDLYEAVEPAVAAAGLTPLFEVRPHLWPNAAVGQPAIISKPGCLMTIVPGSLSASADLRTGRGSITFSAIEARG